MYYKCIEIMQSNSFANIKEYNFVTNKMKSHKLPWLIGLVLNIALLASKTIRVAAYFSL